MTTSREHRSVGFTTLLCALAALPGLVHAQVRSSLPATAPTGTTAPIAAVATPADRAHSPHHRAQVTCAGGRLEVRADNSSLNGILRAIASCTGMQITGGVADQRVFGVYGPAAPATVIATLLDGTGTNMLLKETASDQPAQLILSPRTGGLMPPSPSQVPDDDADQPGAAAGTAPEPFGPGAKPPAVAQPGANASYATSGATSQPAANQTPVPQPVRGSMVSSPPSMPPTINNVMGSPSNTSPTASTYPTTNSVPLDSLPTPSTTPMPSGIVDAPNPPPAGSDTAKMMNGSTTQVPGTTTMTTAPTSNATSPGGTNTSTPAGASTSGNGANGALTPQQVYQQLMQMQQQKQQQNPQNQQQAPATPAPTPQ